MPQSPRSGDVPSNNSESDLEMDENQPGQSNDCNPSKIRKKPGRKPNPASPALRKAQNRAAQRAFRDRKERHLRELEASVKELREERNRLHTENEQFKAELNTMRNENWYMKGMLLSMHLACFRYGIILPQHAPHIDDETLELLSHVIPGPTAAYIQARAKNKPPPTIEDSTHIQPLSHRKTRERFISKGLLLVTKDDIQTHAFDTRDFDFPKDKPEINLSTVLHASSSTTSSAPLALDRDEDAVTSNIAAIQTLRLRLRLQSACAQMDSRPFALQPTPLQLTVPHDPRIDLIPTGAMRDRMILFRDLFDLDDCFQHIIGEATFLGGDPTSPSSWQLSPEFFDKYWYLTADYSTQRMINRWQTISTLQSLPEQILEINDPGFSHPCPQTEKPRESASSSPFSSNISSRSSVSSTSNDLFLSSPIQLTKEGYIHPVASFSSDHNVTTRMVDGRDNDYVNQMIDSLINTDQI
ncbi:hypothetical protein BX666DRAFT_961112 [Dichotomocladium elegans]|nr:hypothetical protein BX666DRAFT_961112 [Dichotomocladium elegans]